jgi:hypothetical protein
VSESEQSKYEAEPGAATDVSWKRFLRTANFGRVVVTQAAAKVLKDTKTDLMVLLRRNANRDWGQVEADDRAANDRAVISGQERTYSNYQLAEGIFVWVVMEADRSAVLVCLPDEYL